MNDFLSKNSTYNYYGDESCHLLNDNNKYMALGSICCPKEKSKMLSAEIREIKKKNGLSEKFEIKNTKVSMGAIDFYRELVNWFLSCDALKFRVVLINKSLVDNKAHHQTHNDFYYKMYFTLFRYFLFGVTNYIYLDYKDSQSYQRCAKLEEILNNTNKNTPKKSFVNQINSTESNLIQLTDLLTGLVCYNANRRKSNPAKCELISILNTKLGIDLLSTTSFNDDNIKFDILNWRSNK